VIAVSDPFWSAIVNGLWTTSIAYGVWVFVRVAISWWHIYCRAKSWNDEEER
jgi:hypothetical protein